MPSLSPVATYHAELRQHLDGMGRALSTQRGLTWGARGLALGLALDLGGIAWAWTREAVATLPLVGLIAAPLVLMVVAAIAAMSYVRQTPSYLARQVDAAAGLQERSITALELGARGAEHPLVVVQMRDAVEHLKRVEPLEAFPLRAPRSELIGSALLLVLLVMVAFAPNPWAIRARAANPAISVAREQAQRVERLAESVEAEGLAELEQLREALRRGAQTIETRSSQPEEALAALEDLENQVRQLSLGDDQLASALAAIASALAGDPSTSPLASAINTGDMREIARATRALAERTEQMDGQERQQVARRLRDASQRASRASPAVAGQLGDAADALDGGSAGEDSAGGEGDLRTSSAARQPGSQAGRPGQEGSERSAREALEDLASSAAAAGERQRAQSQLEANRNALERALGRSQSRSGAGQNSRSTTQREQRSAAPTGEDGQGGGAGEQGDGQGNPSGGMGTGGDDFEAGSGLGDGASGFGSGSGQNSLGSSGVSELDPITRPEFVGGGEFWADEMIENPFLGEAGQGEMRTGEEGSSPTFARRTTQGGESGSIPLGLRDLVKDYFSALDQK